MKILVPKFIGFLIIILIYNPLSFAMEKKPYHHLPDGTFRNPEGSPERSGNVNWSFKIFNKEYLNSKILSFNGGVEIGQIIALIIAFPLLLVLKKKFENISDLSNKILILAGTLLLVFQLNGYFTSKEDIEIFEPEKTEINHIDSENEPEKKSTHTHKHGDQDRHEHHKDH